MSWINRKRYIVKGTVSEVSIKTKSERHHDEDFFPSRTGLSKRNTTPLVLVYNEDD